MRIDEITIKNFRAFFGEFAVDLRPIHGNQLTLIFGENMSGKTSLFLALNWCLYGQALGRQGEEIPVFSPGAKLNNYLLNAQALEEGEKSLFVRLQMSHGGQAWLLERQAACAGDPLEGDPFTEDVFLRIDGAQRAKSEIRQYVNELLHHEAAQFYFFDGELLAQYERWLDDPQEREVRVKAAVERTVGTAALRLYTDIEDVAEQAETEQRRALNREARGEKLVAELEECLKNRSDVESEVRDYDETIQTLEDDAVRIEREHGDLSDFAQEQGRLSEIAKQIDGATEDIKLAETNIQSLLHEKYWLPLASRSEALSNALWDRLKQVISGPEDEFRLEAIERSLNSGSCVVCEVDLNASTEARLKARKNDLNLGSLERLDAVAVTDLVDRIRACDLFRTEEIEWLRDMENSLLEARSRKVDLDGEEKRIRAEHSDRPRGDREQQMRRLTEINQKLGSARGNRAEAIKQLDELKARAISLQARANMIHTNPAVQRMARISRFAVQAFEKAIDGFREAARERVERGASDVFQQLLTEPGYAGIEIDRNYRLTTVDRDGAALPIPSAGGQQLVTLALIGGLNAAAVHEAPIVMDTPAGRIDRPNRERILRWVQGLDRQVVLMVHSGEFTAEHVREMNVPVGRVYKIEKVGPKSSRIYPASLDGSA